MSHRRAAAALALVVLMTGACGGEDRLGEAQYHSKANAICEQARGRFSKLQRDDFRAYLSRGAQVFRDEIDELRDLNPPKKVEAQFDKYVASLERAADKADQANDRMAEGDESAARRLFEEAGAPATEARTLAKDAGLQACTSS